MVAFVAFAAVSYRKTRFRHYWWMISSAGFWDQISNSTEFSFIMYPVIVAMRNWRDEITRDEKCSETAKRNVLPRFRSFSVSRYFPHNFQTYHVAVERLRR